jgi:DNA-binding CsgD family transcriptional regulator
MGLSWRRGGLADLTRCLALLQGHCAYDSATLERLPAVWQALFQDAAVIFSIVEDQARPLDCRVLAFGASVFVTDSFMACERTGVTPYVSARTIQAELGKLSPILRPRAICAAQARDGLNLLTLHYAEVKEVLSPEEQHQVRLAMFESFIAQHKGYRVKELLQELWDDEIPPPYILGGWGPVRSHYAAFAASRTPREPRPYLLGLTRQEVDTIPGWIAAPVFVWTPPRFGFSPAERALLALAVGGDTDRDLSRALALALPTIKSRWRQIYDRVAAVDLAFLPDRPATNGRRGDEKRRRLMEYLRHHPEELRS